MSEEKRKHPKLTDKELKIIELICDGYSNSDIGNILNISKKTVDNHIFVIYRKLNIKSRYELKELEKFFQNFFNIFLLITYVFWNSLPYFIDFFDYSIYIYGILSNYDHL
jgi:DNA-binding CsgD family transcriptional regulator